VRGKLNHRLMAGNPFGMARHSRNAVRYTQGTALSCYIPPFQGFSDGVYLPDTDNSTVLRKAVAGIHHGLGTIWAELNKPLPLA
jgi:hypothetical protein